MFLLLISGLKQFKTLLVIFSLQQLALFNNLGMFVLIVRFHECVPPHGQAESTKLKQARSCIIGSSLHSHMSENGFSINIYSVTGEPLCFYCSSV